MEDGAGGTQWAGVGVWVPGSGRLLNGNTTQGKTLGSRVFAAPVLGFSLSFLFLGRVSVFAETRVSQTFLLLEHTGQMALGKWEGNIPQVLFFARKRKVVEIKDGLDGSCSSFCARELLSRNKPRILAFKTPSVSMQWI